MPTVLVVRRARVRRSSGWTGGYGDRVATAATPPDLARLAERWHRAPRRWGLPLHAVCSYFAMFPPQLAHVFIRWLTQPKETVYDPSAAGHVGAATNEGTWRQDS